MGIYTASVYVKLLRAPYSLVQGGQGLLKTPIIIKGLHKNTRLVVCMFYETLNYSKISTDNTRVTLPIQVMRQLCILLLATRTNFMVIMRVTSHIIANSWIIIADGGKVKRAVQSHLFKGLHCLKNGRKFMNSLLSSQVCSIQYLC